MLVMGVDENGMGPRLGPLVATELTLEIPSYPRAALCARGLRLGLTDSKQTGGFSKMAFAESVALALVVWATGKAQPRSADAFLELVAPGVRGELGARCPDRSTSEQCWGVDLSLPAFGGDLAFGEELLQKLVGRSSLRILDVESRVACAGMLNARLADGKNKLDVDLELFEELIHAVRHRHGAPSLVVCGMIGGIRDYASRFARVSAEDVQALTSRRGQKRYAIDGLGEVRFEVDADARHLPVALASIVGKYVREPSMRRIGEFYKRFDPELRLASGYHDPVTTRFIRSTEPSRRRLAVATDCFQRRA